MKSITLASIVFTLSFCLNLVAGKNLPYKGSPSSGAKSYPYPIEVEDKSYPHPIEVEDKPYPYPIEVEDTEDNIGKRGSYQVHRGPEPVRNTGWIKGTKKGTKIYGK